MRIYRYFILLAMFSGRLLAQSHSVALNAELQGNRLRLAAPQLHFLEGKPLEQLRNGSSVTFVFELTVSSERKFTPDTAIRERFILSFDLWEERFSVVQAGPQGHTALHLTAPMAEAWCLENIVAPRSALHPEKSFVLRLDCWVEQRENENEPGLTLAGLIDVFSRKGRDTAPKWRAVSAALRLADLGGRNK